MSHARHRFWKCYKTLTCCSLVDNVHTPWRLSRETTSERPKVVQTCGINSLTSKCVSRHNGAHFFDISTSNSGPALVCFIHFDLEVCFVPQRRPLFRLRKFYKSIPVLRSWGFLCVFSSTCASRHNGAQFFISPLASWLRTRSHPTRWCFATFLPFRTLFFLFFFFWI